MAYSVIKHVFKGTGRGAHNIEPIESIVIDTAAFYPVTINVRPHHDPDLIERDMGLNYGSGATGMFACATRFSRRAVLAGGADVSAILQRMCEQGILKPKQHQACQNALTISRP